MFSLTSLRQAIRQAVGLRTLTSAVPRTQAVSAPSGEPEQRVASPKRRERRQLVRELGRRQAIKMIKANRRATRRAAHG